MLVKPPQKPSSNDSDAQQKIDALIEEKQQLQHSLATAEQELQWLKEQIKLGKTKRFDQQSETSRTMQLSLFDDIESDEVTETVTPIDAENERVSCSRKKPQPATGRKIDTTYLPREQKVHDLPEMDKVCSCGCELVKVGEDKSEQLEYIPEVLKVIEHIRPKYSCRRCETITAAPKPEQPLPKALAGSTLITDAIIKKFEHHLHLYRQSQILKQAGI